MGKGIVLLLWRNMENITIFGLKMIGTGPVKQNKLV